MGCEQWREILSAQLDGEATPDEQHTVAGHLETCAGCRIWLDAAATVNRRVRTQVVTDLPDLSERILAAAPRRRRWWRMPLAQRLTTFTGLRAALGLLGAVQLVLGLAQIGRVDVAGHLHVSGQHLWHESAAWNVAVGAGFLFVALRRTSPSELLPMLSAFVVTLVLLSVNDFVASQVAVERLVSHGFLVVGFLIIVLLARNSRRPGEPSDRQQPEESRWRLQPDELDEPAPLRLVPPYSTRNAQTRHGNAQTRHGNVQTRHGNAQTRHGNTQTRHGDQRRRAA
ncbi:zf-HC2 domain-containing protein [Micromonospora sonchi]|nr:zf-HC2 domain-containing protein [Micromonospora sonchi]